MYIVFEGIVGTGKTTQIKLLASFLEQEFPERIILATREPGGSQIAEAIRSVVQGTSFKEEMDPVCTALLYAAARAQSLRKVVIPILQKEGIVLADRSFITSLAYQGCAECLGFQTVLEINSHAIETCLPDLVLFLDLDPEVALARTSDIIGDRWEANGLPFFQQVIEGYLRASNLPILREQWVRIDASRTQEEVFERIKEVVMSRLMS